MTQSTQATAPAAPNVSPAKPVSVKGVASKPVAAKPVPAKAAAPRAGKATADAKATVKAKAKATSRAVPEALAANAGPAVKNDDKRERQRQKLVRDSFTMPRADFDLIEVLKLRAIGFERPTRKSELLRAGLQVLADLSPSQLAQVLDRLPLLKPGRPKNGD